MKFGLIGLPKTGKRTVFAALTGQNAESPSRGESTIGTIEVPDHRIELLKELYKPKKTSRVQIEYLLPDSEEARGNSFPWPKVRDCDGLIHVLRNYESDDAVQPNPLRDFTALGQDLLLADLVVVEKRLERIELDHKRGKKMDPNEHALLERCRKKLETGLPIRKDAELSEAPQLRGYALVSAKPLLVLFNNGDAVEALPPVPDLTATEICVAIRGKIEQELAMMDPEERREFMAAFGIASSAKDRIIRKSFELLGLITFFTVVGDEVRAWAIQAGATALDAAGAVHTDMKRGFIRAEIVAYEDLKQAGSYTEARRRGTVRLEGKAHEVKDGDILHFRFNI